VVGIIALTHEDSTRGIKARNDAAVGSKRGDQIVMMYEYNPAPPHARNSTLHGVVFKILQLNAETGIDCGGERR
jgi:hypothetical protein